jgi:hypothetical protein
VAWPRKTHRKFGVNRRCPDHHMPGRRVHAPPPARPKPPARRAGPRRRYAKTPRVAGKRATPN